MPFYLLIPNARFSSDNQKKTFLHLSYTLGDTSLRFERRISRSHSTINSSMLHSLCIPACQAIGLKVHLFSILPTRASTHCLLPQRRQSCGIMAPALFTGRSLKASFPAPAGLFPSVGIQQALPGSKNGPFHLSEFKKEDHAEQIQLLRQAMDHAHPSPAS